MSKAKISLAGVLAALAALGYGFIAFLGQNYLKIGDAKDALLMAFLMMFSLYVLVLMARATKKVHNNFKRMIMVERLLVLSYIALCFCLIKPFSHFFHVYSKKSSIQKVVLADIDKAKGMYKVYEQNAHSRIAKYDIKLNSIIKAHSLNFNPPLYDQLGFNPSIENQQAGTLLNVLKGKLFPANYKAQKTADSVWLNMAKESIENWKPIAVVDVINNFEKNISIRINQLRGYTAYMANAEDSAAIIPYDPGISLTNVQGKFKKEGQPGVLAIAIGLILCLLMMLDYMVTDRDFKNEQTLLGFKIGKNNNKRGDNKFTVEI